MKKIFLVLCLGIIGFSRISLAAGETGEAITKVKQNAEKIESETSVDKAEEAKEEKEAKKRNYQILSRKRKWNGNLSGGTSLMKINWILQNGATGKMGIHGIQEITWMKMEN